jgi:hypothetical protein
MQKMSSITREEAVVLWAKYKQTYLDAVDGVDHLYTANEKKISDTNKALKEGRAGSIGTIAAIAVLLLFLIVWRFMEARDKPKPFFYDFDNSGQVKVDNPLFKTQMEKHETLMGRLLFGIFLVLIAMAAIGPSLGVCVIKADQDFIAKMAPSFVENKVALIWTDYQDVITENPISPKDVYTSVDDIKIVDPYAP